MTPLLLIAMLASVHGMCPELPARSGLEWRREQGPGFEVCYAHPPGEYNAPFGMHIGSTPRFTRKPGANDKAGVVGGHAVTWQSATGKDGDLPFGMEAMFEIDRGDALAPIPVHVWINARTRDELRDARAVLREIRFHFGD